MYDHVLVPTDGSDTAVAAAEGAVSLARRFDAALHALHVVEGGDLLRFEDEIPDSLVRRGEQAVANVEELANDAGIEVTTTVVEGGEPVHRAIVDYAGEHDIDCIVMGTHGRTGIDRLGLGSVAERTLRVSPVPVFTVHEDTVLAPDFDQILVPTDGSDGARAAADHAIDLATETDGTLHVVHVVDAGVVDYEGGSGTVLAAMEEAGQRAVDEVVANAEPVVQTVQASVLSGTPPRAIVDYAAERDVDCIVMGTHGRTGARRLLLGSVTERVVRLSDVPVLGVKAADASEADESS